MVINFKLEDYDDICDEYESFFENEDVVDVINGDDLLVVRMRRIVIPELHVSFREAEWYGRNVDVEDPDNEDAWECQCSVFVQYEENEKDAEKYISFATSDLAYYASELLGKNDNGYDKVSQLDCYIDTDEFVNQEYKKTEA